MYPAPFDYHRPSTLNEALHLLTTLGGAATVLAGGQSLIPMMKLRVGEFRHVVDIGRLSGLAYIERRGDTLHIGALARHAQIAASPIAQEIPLLADVAGGIADRAPWVPSAVDLPWPIRAPAGPPACEQRVRRPCALARRVSARSRSTN